MTPALDPLVEAFDSRIEAKIKAFVIAAKRPEYVTQRTVTDVLGMPSEDYLDHGRAVDFETWKVGRLVYAKVEAVATFIEAHPVSPRAANDVAAETYAIRGARRVST